MVGTVSIAGLGAAGTYLLEKSGEWQKRQDWAQGQISDLLRQSDISGGSGPPRGNPNAPKGFGVAAKIFAGITIAGVVGCIAEGFSDCEDRIFSGAGGNGAQGSGTQGVRLNSASGGAPTGADSSANPTSFSRPPLSQFISGGGGGSSFMTAQSTALTNLYNALLLPIRRSPQHCKMSSPLLVAEGNHINKNNMNNLGWVIFVSALVDTGVIIAILHSWQRYNSKGSIFALIVAVIALAISALSYIGYLVSFPPGYTILTSFLTISAWCWSVWITFKDRRFLWYSVLLLVLFLLTLYGFAVLKVDLKLPFGEWPVSYFVWFAAMLGAALPLMFV